MSAPTSEWRTGWRAVVAAGLGMGAGVSMFATAFGFFVVPLQEEFGWTRTQAAMSAFAILAASLSMPFVGALLDRFGARIFALIGACAFAVAYTTLAAMQGNILLFFFILGLVALVAGPATTPLVYARPIIAHFHRARGFALGVGLSGSYALIILLAPALQCLIGVYSWRAGFALLAIIAFVFGLVAAWLLGKRARPGVEHDESLATEGVSLGGALKQTRFWLLAFALIASNLPIGGVISQLQPMLADGGTSPQIAALLGSWYAASILVGRLCTGVLLDRYWAPAVGALALTAPSIGLVLLAGGAGDVVLFGTALSLIGLAHGAESDLLSFFAARYFGVRSFGVIAGLLGMLVGVSIAAGGLLFAMASDQLGSYAPALVSSAVVMVLAAGALFASGLLR